MKTVCKCGKEFNTKQFLINTGKGKYCSKKCMYKYRIRPKGLIYIQHKENPTSFVKGQKPWNYGFKGLYFNNGEKLKGRHLSPNTEFKKGQEPWNKGVPFLQIRDENHPTWKGNDVGYQGLHSWMRLRLGKANRCEFCGKTGRIHWANKSHEYKRNLDDWIQLCPKCHKKYDKKTPDFCNCGKLNYSKGMCKSCYRKYRRKIKKLVA
jgi:hypothetical protein